jgi:NAD(P)-dependent dehydrogenase (short-subunit alcohol dehydrogenase family)
LWFQALGHQHLVSLLLPLLVKTSQASPSDPPRVIITSSAGHATAPAEGVKFESVIRDKSVQPNQKTADDKPVKGANELGKWPEYGQSKWGNIAVARYLHWLYGPSEGRKKETVSLEKKAGNGEIISIALHPGLIASGLGRHLSGTDFVFKWMPWIAVSKSTRDAARETDCPLFSRLSPRHRRMEQRISYGWLHVLLH